MNSAATSTQLKCVHERPILREHWLYELHELKRMVNSPVRRDWLPGGCKSDNNCITSRMAESRADLCQDCRMKWRCLEMFDKDWFRWESLVKVGRAVLCTPLNATAAYFLTGDGGR